MPELRSGAIASPISLSVRASVAVTFPRRADQTSAVATPVLASPTTSTRLPRNSNGFAMDPAKPFSQDASLPQFQRRQSKQRKNQRSDPKPHDHFRFAPAEQFEMVMNGRHAEDALAAQFERAHLQTPRNGFQYKNAADEKQQNLLLDNDGDHAQRPAQRERAHVSHENFRGMRVVPQEAEGRADESATEHRQFTDLGDVLNVEVGRPTVIAADVSQHREAACGENGTANGRTAQPILRCAEI